MLWFEMFFWHFLFLIEVLTAKIIAVPWKLMKSLGCQNWQVFFLNKIFNNWPYFSSLVKKKQQQKIKSHTFYISLCPQHSFTSIANLPKFPWAPWEHRSHHRTHYWIWCSAACYRSQYLLIEIEVFSLLDAGPMKTFTEVLQVQVQWLTYN